MKLVEWEDSRGWKHKALLRDNDPDTNYEQGIPQDPPDIEELDWEGVKRDLHNALLDYGLRGWSDVLQSQDGLVRAVNHALLRPLQRLYRR